MHLKWWTWLVVALMASWSAAAPAEEPPEDPPEEPPNDDAVLKQACSDSYVKAQELRTETRLIEALDQLRVCVDEACPDFMREHCSTWIDEVEKAMPTVVPELVDEDGHARNDVRVTVDERLLTERLDGRPLSVDPGEHVFVFELGGGAPVHRVFTIASGEKNRKLVVTLVKPKPTEPPPTEPSEGGRIHPGAWALSTVALAGFGVFIGFGIQSITLEECQPICSDEQVDEIETHRVVADVGLAVGATALAAAVVVAIVFWDSSAEDVASLELRFDASRALLRGAW